MNKSPTLLQSERIEIYGVAQQASDWSTWQLFITCIPGARDYYSWNALRWKLQNDEDYKVQAIRHFYKRPYVFARHRVLQCLFFRYVDYIF